MPAEPARSSSNSSNHNKTEGFNKPDAKASTSAVEDLMNHHLSPSLHLLSTRHRSFKEIANHLDQQYLVSKRVGGEDQARHTLRQTKEQLAQALQLLASDVSTITEQFDRLLELESDGIDAVSAQVGLLQSRIGAAKTQRLNASMLEMTLPLSSAVMSDKPSVRDASEAEIVLPRHLIAGQPTARK